MSKLGISIKIDVSKIDKARLFNGEKGTYLNLTTFIDTNETDQYGNHGFISQETSKEERAAKYQTPILGNCKVFYGAQQSQAPTAQAPSNAQEQPPAMDANFDDDIPFSCPHSN